MKKAKEHLRKDPVMRRLIERHGDDLFHLGGREEPDLVANLLEIIVGQQLSIKAAETIWGRFRGLYGARNFPDVRAIVVTDKRKLRGVKSPRNTDPPSTNPIPIRIAPDMMSRTLTSSAVAFHYSTRSHTRTFSPGTVVSPPSAAESEIRSPSNLAKWRT